MKSMQRSLLASALCIFAAISAVSAAADDFPQTTTNARLSVTRGFIQSSLPVLDHAGTRDVAQVSTALLAKMCPGHCLGKSSRGPRDSLRVSGNHWLLKVEADGTSAECQDFTVEKNAHSSAKPVSEKMSASELEQKGRAFINSNLISVIGLGPGEELVPVRTAYLIEGGQDMVTSKITRSVAANRIVFGRIVNGVPVVGGGSMVVVTFTGDGALESFRYDWPKYQAGKEQAVVAAAEILQRVQKVVSARRGVAGPTSAATVPSDEGDAYPVVLTPNASLDALECGYYDPGVAARHAGTPVQPGCLYHAISQDSDGMRRGFAGAVPGGVHFQVAVGWAETQILAVRGESLDSQ
jgi:hypothetical protein